MKRMNEQKGFTIIELVVVILLLGILTATALPRFMDVTDEAHDAVVNGVLTGLITSSGLYRASWFAEGQPATVNDYDAIPANDDGYAIGAAGVATITGAQCVTIFETFLQDAGRPAITGLAALGTLVATNLSLASPDPFTAKGTAGGICRYAYTGQFADGASGNNPVIEYDSADGTFVLSSTEL